MSDDATMTVEEMRDYLSALRQARYSGAARVEYVGNGVRRVMEFRSSAELAATIADLEGRLGGPRPRNIPVRQIDGWSGGGARELQDNWRGHGFRGRNVIGE